MSIDVSLCFVSEWCLVQRELIQGIVDIALSHPMLPSIGRFFVSQAALEVMLGTDLLTCVFETLLM